MRIQTGLLALTLAVSAAPLSAQIARRPDPRDRQPTSTGTIGDIIFGSRVEAPRDCRVRDAVTPDGRVVQICDGPAYEHRRDGRGRRPHVNDMDGDGDFDARDRALRRAEHERWKAHKKRQKELRRGDDD